MEPQYNTNPHRRSVFWKTLWILLALATVSLRLDAESKRPPFKVSLSVSAPDQDSALITSYLSRQLREFQDVIITEEAPLFQIDVIAMRVTIEQGSREVGLAISTVITSVGSTAGGHFMHITNSNELPRTCAKIIAEFDQRKLEPLRKLMSYTGK